MNDSTKLLGDAASYNCPLGGAALSRRPSNGASRRDASECTKRSVNSFGSWKELRYVRIQNNDVGTLPILRGILVSAAVAEIVLWEDNIPSQASSLLTIALLHRMLVRDEWLDGH
jgi:hypothetical protein